jgi:hypothetical protein
MARGGGREGGREGGRKGYLEGVGGELAVVEGMPDLLNHPPQDGEHGDAAWREGGREGGIEGVA